MHSITLSFVLDTWKFWNEPTFSLVYISLISHLWSYECYLNWWVIIIHSFTSLLTLKSMKLENNQHSSNRNNLYFLFFWVISKVIFHCFIIAIGFMFLCSSSTHSIMWTLSWDFPLCSFDHISLQWKNSPWNASLRSQQVLVPFPSHSTLEVKGKLGFMVPFITSLAVEIDFEAVPVVSQLLNTFK